MCLVAIASGAHPDLPLIVLGNRDEAHVRPSAPAHWWTDAAEVLGGRDLVAGGSWLGVNRRGRFAVVTNRPQKPPSSANSPSRGALVRDFLTGADSGEAFQRRLEARRAAYAGFCLAFGECGDLRLVSEPADDDQSGIRRHDGVLIITNAPNEQRWPKSAYMEQALCALLEAGRTDADSLLEPLERSEPVAELPPGQPEVAVRPFVVGEKYGTRSSTLLTISGDGECRFVERRYGPNGVPDGESQFEFVVDL